MGIGRSHARVYAAAETKATFADVAGQDQAQDELLEIVAFLKAPARYGRLGTRVPKGVLLVGPEPWIIPMQARFVIDRRGLIAFSETAFNYDERREPCCSLVVSASSDARARDLADHVAWPRQTRGTAGHRYWVCVSAGRRVAKPIECWPTAHAVF